MLITDGYYRVFFLSLFRIILNFYFITFITLLYYFQEEELKDIIATARDMEARWGHLFDMIIINNDTERAYHQLLAEINSLEREPQWVPASWVHNNRDES